MAASVKSRRACGPSFVFLAKARSWDALKSPRNDTGIAMTNLHRSPPMNQSKTDLGIVNESQLLRFGISSPAKPSGRRQGLRSTVAFARSTFLPFFGCWTLMLRSGDADADFLALGSCQCRLTIFGVAVELS